MNDFGFSSYSARNQRFQSEKHSDQTSLLEDYPAEDETSSHLPDVSVSPQASDSVWKHRKELSRPTNQEDLHPFLCNLLYIFYFPFICRSTPITDEDIPVISKEDESESAIDRVRAIWNPIYESYVKKVQHPLYVFSFFSWNYSSSVMHLLYRILRCYCVQSFKSILHLLLFSPFYALFSRLLLSSNSSFHLLVFLILQCWLLCSRA